jgi:hypothetical protein
MRTQSSLQGPGHVPARISPDRSGEAANILPGILLLLVLAFGMSGCNMSGSSTPSQSSFGSPPDLSVVQATDLGTISTNPDILGRDGAYSASFQGYSVWLYGDTFLANANAQNRTLISDSWSFTSDLNAQDGISGFQEQLDGAGAPTMILPETPDEQAFNQAHNSNACQAQPCGARWALWPSSIVVNAANNSALIFYMVVNSLPGDFNVQSIGSSVAVWPNIQQPPQRPTLDPPVVADHPDLIFTQSEPNFGSAAFVSNGTLYAYAAESPTTAWIRVAGSEKLLPQARKTVMPGPSTRATAIGLPKLAARFPSSPATIS